MCKSIFVTALAALGLAAAAPAEADEIYRWVDDSGQVHYSDVPRDGAEQIELNPAQAFSSPALARSSSSPENDSAAAKPAESYDALEIVSPTQEETIWNTGGIITVSVSPNPSLKQGHSLRIYYDGKQIETPSPRTTSIQLSKVFRGEHKLSAEILDVTGRVVKKSQSVTFYYQQRSLQNQTRRAASPTN